MKITQSPEDFALWKVINGIIFEEKRFNEKLQLIWIKYGYQKLPLVTQELWGLDVYTENQRVVYEISEQDLTMLLLKS